MRTHWWQSIRWKLALGSMLMALLATLLLAVIVIVSVLNYYNADQRANLTTLAGSNAQRIGVAYEQDGARLPLAANTTLNPFVTHLQGEDYLVIVLNHRSQLVYPNIGVGRATFVTTALAATDPGIRRVDYLGVRNAVAQGQRGTLTVGQIGAGGTLATPRPFVVEPIFAGGQNDAPVVGVLFMTLRSAVENTVPPFAATVIRSVLVTSLFVALAAILFAILFASTITRPLAKLTEAARGVASGNYAKRVNTGAQGELGDLANAFNEMASRLEQDVDELRRQEIWRRELLMNITHDLATPLTAIAGLGESLVDGVNSSREDYEATGRIIVRETLRLRRLVRDLHMMSKMEAGALHPQRVPLRLPVLVDEVLAVLTPEFERADVEPCNRVPYNLPLIQADPDMLSRVFSNLCDNALRHTPAGGSVTVDAAPYGNVLVIAVTDTGKGIATAALPRVFDRFYRADTARQADTGGSGLGLAIVRAIIAAHGGQIRAENAPGAGARILFTLPLL
ncbi:MAG: HAMP domain-containing histidine kinase [Ktedonobacteraceae bacterium]|nr:HAMP domain-containing histidine kinase [Ktedonobacteraceae bacterium]